jgi:ADP-ribosylglycohydrolase
MITRATLAANSVLAREKATGCLIGLAVGDALGDIGRSDAFRQRYGIVTNLYQGAKSTDDTEFAVLTGRALLDNNGDLTPAAVAAAWKTYVLDQGGIYERAGKPLLGAAENLKRGVMPPLSGRDNVNNYDDGAAMRIAPIGVVCAGDPDRAARLAELDAQVSHYADGIYAAQAVAASVSVAMVDGSPSEIISAGLRQIPGDSWLGRAMATAMDICDQSGAGQAGDIEQAWERLHTELWTPVHSAAAEAIPQAYAVFRLCAGDFTKAMFWGGNFGRDADTIGAVLGALTGARHGLSVIPSPWIELVRRPSGVCLKFAANEDIVALASALAELIR